MPNEHDDFGDPVGPGIEEILLLAIIDAYPDHDAPSCDELHNQQRRADRLRRAMEALFARKPSKGRPESSDDPALRWMGEQFVNDRARATMRATFGITAAWTRGPIRSIRNLAKDAASRFHSGEHQAVAERLRSKFSKEQAYWVRVAQTHDDLPEMRDHNVLMQIAELLDRCGVRMKVTKIKDE